MQPTTSEEREVEETERQGREPGEEAQQPTNSEKSARTIFSKVRDALSLYCMCMQWRHK